MDNRIWIKISIPDKSNLEVSVQGTGTFGATGELAAENNAPDTTWTKAQLSPGPARKQLRSPLRYVGRVVIAFQTAGTVTISARIVKLDGSQLGKAFSAAITGSAGASAQAILVLSTKKGAPA